MRIRQFANFIGFSTKKKNACESAVKERNRAKENGQYSDVCIDHRKVPAIIYAHSACEKEKHSKYHRQY